MTNGMASGSGGVYNYGVYSYFYVGKIKINHSVIKGTSQAIALDDASLAYVTYTEVDGRYLIPVDSSA